MAGLLFPLPNLNRVHLSAKSPSPQPPATARGIGRYVVDLLPLVVELLLLLALLLLPVLLELRLARGHLFFSSRILFFLKFVF